MSVYDAMYEVEGLRKAALELLCGERLGSGSTRRVYALKHSPDLVIKLEYALKKFCNVAEYDMWHTVKGTKLERFFAPVVDIDTYAGALIMRRTQPITEEEFRKEVKRLPAFLDDNHSSNFGRLDGRIVCHDYGYHAAISHAVKVGALKKVVPTP